MLQKKIERQNDRIAHLKDELSITRNKAKKERKYYEEALKKAADNLSAAEKEMKANCGAITLIIVIVLLYLYQ